MRAVEGAGIFEECGSIKVEIRPEELSSSQPGTAGVAMFARGGAAENRVRQGGWFGR